MKNGQNRNGDGLTYLSATATIRVPRHEVWEVVQEIGNIMAFHPLIKESRLLNSVKGIGARRLCQLKPMGTMEEQITAWNDGIGFVTEVTGGKMLPPYEIMRGTLKLEEEGARTRVTFTFCYKLKFGLLGRVINALLVKPQFKGAPIKYVEGLKMYMERERATPSAS